jgi:hypothetical protein
VAVVLVLVRDAVQEVGVDRELAVVAPVAQVSAGVLDAVVLLARIPAG